FAARLCEARTRRGEASFEGLFVKNLENVQGDERDHIVISTTYGPDPKGKFRRQFGPLGRAGGGRRLNVLVTRARQEVHLVTSIPREVYAALAPLEPGQVPSGAWLLFSYLQWAEQLERDYAEEGERLAQAEAVRKVVVRERETKAGSALARALARQIAQKKGVGADVHWGNEGFCVDVALHHPSRAEDVTVGILCDGTRFAKAPDRVEWDLFRSAVLEGQGWKLVRLWTPQFFRDPEAALRRVEEEVAAVVAKEAAPPQPPVAALAAAKGEGRVLH
ncbi:MAG: DNA helicase, partial [Deltaproteobacteria bacterium]|nr:DNA helicase [Deltaproteobacteria bacterium]